MSGKSKKKLLSPEVLEAAVQEVDRLVVTINAERNGDEVVAMVIGGFAMQHYGSPRLTGDVDFVASARLGDLKPIGDLSFGGFKFKTRNGTPADWILRDDDYQSLYDEALDHAVRTKAGYAIVRPEYLGAMKFATQRSIDQEDLIFLLQQPRLVNRKKLRDIVYRLVGGKYALEDLDSIISVSDWRKKTGRLAYGE
jgi:hypothetical protein